MLNKGLMACYNMHNHQQNVREVVLDIFTYQTRGGGGGGVLANVTDYYNFMV